MIHTQRAAVIDAALSWVGTPFHHGACVKGAGVDCGRFVVAVYQAAGVPMPEDIPLFKHDFFLHERTERYLDLVQTFLEPVAEPLPGDLAMFKFGRVFGHGAVVLNWPEVIHADSFLKRVGYGNASQVPLARREVKFFSPWR